MHVNNYRPISLLSVFDKIIEKLMYNRWINALSKALKHSIIFEGQFGFQSNHSTTHALRLVDKIQKSIELTG